MPSRNLNELPREGKLIAFDVGEKTYGIATCDGLRLAATPLPTLPRGKWTKDKPAVVALLKREGVVGIIVGFPLNMDGSYSASTDRSLSFAHLIKEETGIPVFLWDERLSTVAAEKALFEQRTGRQTRASKRDVKEHVDSVAAALILQGVLRALEHQQ